MILNSFSMDLRKKTYRLASFCHEFVLEASWDRRRSETTEKVGKVKKKTGQHGIIEASNTRGCGDAEDQGKAVELL